MLFDTRASSTIEDYRENVRIASLTYSKVYEQTTNYNGLNEFNLSTANFKDIDDKYQSIQKLYSTDTDVIVFQEDKVHRILFQKSVIFNADGSGNISQNSNILGQEVAYAGEYGISKNPESFAFFGNRKYFVDTRRGAVLRLSLDGITEISQNGMHDFFRDNFRELPYSKKLGAWDLHEGQYVIHVDDTDTSPSTEIVCDATANFYQLSEPIVYNILMNEGGGSTNMAYTISGSDTITVQVEEDEGAGPTTTFTDISGSSTGSVTRTVTTPNTWIITVTPTAGTPDVTLNFPCTIAV
jgi:hypothetical protein